jgi:hypothetical protein
MLPFNIEAVKQGHPCITRHGVKINRFLTFNLAGRWPICYTYSGPEDTPYGQDELVNTTSLTGSTIPGRGDLNLCWDLFLAEPSDLIEEENDYQTTI